MIERHAARDVVAELADLDALQLGLRAEADAALGRLEEARAEARVGGETRLLASVQQGQHDARVSDDQIGRFEHRHERRVGRCQHARVVAPAATEQRQRREQRNDQRRQRAHQTAAGPRRRPITTSSSASTPSTAASIAGPIRPSPLDAHDAY